MRNNASWPSNCKKCGCQLTNYGSGRPRTNCGNHKKFRVLLGSAEKERRRVAFIQVKRDRQYALVNEIKLSIGECFYHEHYFGYQLGVQQFALKAFCFDHVDRVDKIDTISEMIGRYTDEQIIVEINKCVLCCANCHQIKTYANKDYLSLKEQKSDSTQLITQLQLFAV